MNETELYHHGILGQKWGIRRYQNKDGTLTPAGRERLGIKKYEDEHSSDIVLKKGTKVNRVISANRYDEYREFKGKKAAEEYKKDVLAKDNELNTRYVSVDNVRNSGRIDGKTFYTSWFGNEGFELGKLMVSDYVLKNDIKIASGKQVMDALLEEIGPKRVREILKNDSSDRKFVRGVLQEYTKMGSQSSDLFNRVNQRFIDKGYDAIEDIYDSNTDMPIILLNANSVLKQTRVQSGIEAVNEIIENSGRWLL